MRLSRSVSGKNDTSQTMSLLRFLFLTGLVVAVAVSQYRFRPCPVLPTVVEETAAASTTPEETQPKPQSPPFFESTVPQLSPQKEHQEQQQLLLQCLEQVLQYELPILPTTGEMINGKNQKATYGGAVFAHFGDSGDWRRWNKAVAGRTLPMPGLTQAPCAVWEVGANTEAVASREYLAKYPDCQYHAFEPIPQFVQELHKHWDAEPRMHIHAYGLAAQDSSFGVNPADLAGLSTYIQDSQGGSITAYIKNFDFALNEAGGPPTLFDVNCEGCEYDLLIQAKKHGFLEQIPYIQIGWHNYGEVGIGTRAWQLCQIRTFLSETHTMVRGLGFGWDRWELKLA